MKNARDYCEEIVANDDSGKFSNANRYFESHVRCFTNVGKDILCRKARLKREFFAIFFAMFLSMQFADAQGTFAIHPWLNDLSVNYTLSYPTRQGQWMLAAAKREQGVTLKNTIAVLRLDNNYNILPLIPGNRVQVIGLSNATGNGFEKDIDFEVHGIVQSFNSDEDEEDHFYIICGSMRKRITAEGLMGTQNGMVIILPLARFCKPCLDLI